MIPAAAPPPDEPKLCGANRWVYDGDTAASPFDMPVRFVIGVGTLTGAFWMMTRPKDVPLVQAAEAQKKVIVRTASGAIPPGLGGSESETMYQKRMNLATNDAKHQH